MCISQKASQLFVGYGNLDKHYWEPLSANFILNFKCEESGFIFFYQGSDSVKNLFKVHIYGSPESTEYALKGQSSLFTLFHF